MRNEAHSGLAFRTTAACPAQAAKRLAAIKTRRTKLNRELFGIEFLQTPKNVSKCLLIGDHSKSAKVAR